METMNITYYGNNEYNIFLYPAFRGGKLVQPLMKFRKSVSKIGFIIIGLYEIRMRCYI